jgi:hypothetical protein
MRVAITFRDQPEHERRGNEYDYPSLSRREAESLPHVIELETPALFNHKVTSASSRNWRAGFPARASRNRQGCLFDETGTMPVLRPKGRGETFGRATRIRHERAKISVAFSLAFAAAEPEPNDSVSGYWNRKSALLIPPTSGRDAPKAECRNSGKLRR